MLIAADLPSQDICEGLRSSILNEAVRRAAFRGLGDPTLHFSCFSLLVCVKPRCVNAVQEYFSEWLHLEGPFVLTLRRDAPIYLTRLQVRPLLRLAAAVCHGPAWPAFVCLRP